MTDAGCVLGMDVGGTYIRAGAVDSENKLVFERIVPTVGVMGSADSCGAFIDWIRKLLRDFGQPVTAICLGLPAVLDKERRQVLSAPNVPCLNGQPMAALLEEAFSIPVFLEKDACLLLYHDLYAHNIPMQGTLIGIYIGTGLGNAVIIDGKPYVGRNGAACEVGHIPCLDKDGICTCGNPACMEVYSSGKALEVFQAAHFPDTPLRDLFVRHREDPRILKMIQRFAVPIATEINIFDPDYVVLGGGVLAMRGFPREQLESCIHIYARKPYPDETVQLIYAEPSQYNGILGAAFYARSRMEE